MRRWGRGGALVRSSGLYDDITSITCGRPRPQRVARFFVATVTTVGMSSKRGIARRASTGPALPVALKTTLNMQNKVRGSSGVFIHRPTPHRRSNLPPVHTALLAWWRVFSLSRAQEPEPQPATDPDMESPPSPVPKGAANRRRRASVSAEVDNSQVFPLT